MMIRVLLSAQDISWLWLGRQTPAMRERLVVLGSLLAVALAVALLALMLHGRRRRRPRHRHHRHHRSAADAAPEGESVESKGFLRRRRRRRRREHRRLNPTLAETGGLPPIRPDEPPPPTDPGPNPGAPHAA